MEMEIFSLIIGINRKVVTVPKLCPKMTNFKDI